MKIVLFSDVHGHLRLVLHLIRNWQIAHSSHVDAALIAGDLGCFPDRSKFDKATKKHIERDLEQAGFAEYFTSPRAEVERLFAPEFGEFSAVRCPILFVPGNHEDYEYIASASRQAPAQDAPRNTFPVDCYRRIHCITDGSVVTLDGEDNASLRVAGIWGIENARQGAPYQLKASMAERLRVGGPQTFDLLLTHDAPAEAYPSVGQTRTSGLINEVVLPRETERLLHGNASVTSEYFRRALDRAMEKRGGVAFMHSHLGPGWQGMSNDDIQTEQAMAAQAKGATGLPLVGMTAGTDGAWSARYWEKSAPRHYERVWCQSVRIIGEQRLDVTFADKIVPPPRLREELKRTVSVWGIKQQQKLSRLKFGVVGAGSVGSIVAETLARITVIRSWRWLTDVRV